MVLRSFLTLRRLRRDLWRPRAELEQRQRRKLKVLLHQAYENVPYYRELFDSVGLKPQSVESIDDLRNFPITDKAVLRTLPRDQILARNIDRKDCVEVFTSGSTGMPTRICFTREDHALLDLVYLRSFLENGLRLRHKRAFLLDPHSFDTRKRWYHLLGLARATNISCFLAPPEQIRMLEECRPDFIHGYPSSLRLISQRILEAGYNAPPPAIISTAAELLAKEDRQLVHSAFGVNIFDRYAARECGNIAWECEENNGYHINIDTLVVEFIRGGRDAKPGEPGDIVVTNLHSFAMPFIRYRIGDVGIPSGRRCPCGRDLPLMEIVEGRREDFLIRKNGERISPMMVTGTVDHIPGIKQYRIVQEDRDTIVAILATGEAFSPTAIDLVGKGLRRILGEDMLIRCHVVEDIPRESSGKVRAVVSKVSQG